MEPTEGSNRGQPYLFGQGDTNRSMHSMAEHACCAGTEEVGLAAMEGWHWAGNQQEGLHWNQREVQTGVSPTSLEGVDSLPEAMARSRQQASRRVSRSNSRQFERMSSQVREERAT